MEKKIIQILIIIFVGIVTIVLIMFSDLIFPPDFDAEETSFLQIEMSRDENLLNLNEASIEEIMRVDGIGEVIASRILDYKKEKGEIQVLEELLQIEGIGDKIYGEIQKLFYV